MAMCLGGQNVGNEEIRDDVNVHFASEVLVGVGGKKLGIDPTHIKSSQQEFIHQLGEVGTKRVVPIESSVELIATWPLD